MKFPQKNPVIGIIGGRGMLGRIFREAFETAGYEVLISGRKPDGRKVLANKDLVKKADVVIVSVFLKDAQRIIGEIAPLLNSRQLFLDFTSLKSESVAAMLKSKAEVVGLHPMFGEVESLVGHNIFVCPIRAKKWWTWLRMTLIGFGLEIHKISPKKHDELAAIHQSLPHLFSIAFAVLLKKRGIDPAELFQISSPSTQLELLTTARLLSQNAEMYADIQLLNPGSVKVAVDFAKIFGDLTTAVANCDRQYLLKVLNSANRYFGAWCDFALVKTNKLFKEINRKKIITELVPKKSAVKKSVAILGPATQTELAATGFLQRKKLKLPFQNCTTNAEVFTAVSSGKALFGIVPLENLSIGPVRETMRNLFDAGGKIKIVAEIDRAISHALLGRKKIAAKKVNQIFAHPQAIAQSQKFLLKNFPQAEIVETSNSGVAVEFACQESDSLAIAPAIVAANSGLQVLAREIEDDLNNRTRFVVIARRIPPNVATKTARRTAIAFYFAENKAGQLARSLQIFAKNKINLSRIESIPTEKKRGEFFFFVECEINSTDPRFRNAKKELREIANVVSFGNF